MFRCSVFAFVLSAAALGSWNAASAADAATTPNKKVVAATTFRADKLDGLNVRNEEGEKIGTVDDIVLDLASGKISYIAVSFGGWLGMGDKLFAVPYKEFRFSHSKDGEQFFVLDVTKEKLKTAPGFDKNAWPNFADQNWARDIDKYYEEHSTARRTGESTR